MTKPMTEAQAAVLNDVWFEVCLIIKAECHKRNLNTQLDDILSDAITRTCTAIAKHGTENAELIKSRARSCSLDAIRTAYRQQQNVLKYQAAVSAAAHTARHNGDPMLPATGGEA